MAILDEMFQKAQREDSSPLTPHQYLKVIAKEKIAKAIKEGEVSASVLAAFLCVLRQEVSNKPAIFEIFLAECLKEMDHKDPETLHILAECMGDHPIAWWARRKLEDFIIE